MSVQIGPPLLRYFHPQLFLNPVHPLDVRKYLVNRKTDRFSVELLELVVALHESTELGYAHRGEIPAVAEQNDPFPFVILRTLLHPLRRMSLDTRHPLANQRDTLSLAVSLYGVFSSLICLVQRLVLVTRPVDGTNIRAMSRKSGSLIAVSRADIKDDISVRETDLGYHLGCDMR